MDAGPLKDAGASSDAGPSTTDTADTQLPAGHPLPSQRPHGGHGEDGEPPGMFRAPEDTSQEDPSLPAGTIAVDLRDPDENPIPATEVSLGIVIQSIAKGESRKHLSSTTDASGRATFAQLDTGSEIAYRVTCARDGGSFAAMPFRLPPARGQRVVLHVYPVTHNINEAAIGMRTILYAEVRDDRIQFEQVYGIFNIGKVAWVPTDTIIALPDDYTGFSTQQGMSDQGVDSDKNGARIRGTFGPGQHIIDFRWQLLWSGEKDIEADVGLLPHVFGAVVRTPASDPIKLTVEGFPDAQRATDEQGQHVLSTERALREGDQPLSHVHLALHDLPVAGPGRIIATILAMGGVGLGLAFAVSTGREKASRGASGAKSLRAQLLAELEDLERARAAGDVGPKTYERARRDLIDAIARTLEK
jgi:hypothetical protein